MCRCICSICALISFGFTVAGIIFLPPSLPSFTLNSVALLNATATGNSNVTVATLTPQYWQVSFFLRNPNVKSLRSPAKRGAISYDRINAFLFQERHDDEGGAGVFHNLSSAPFEQRAGERTALEVNFPAGAEVAMKDDAVKLSLRWGAEARFHGKTKQSKKVGLVEAVCEDVNVLLSPGTGMIHGGGDVECLVGGTWLSYDELADMTWIMIWLANMDFCAAILILVTSIFF